jgi:hypothetical protein
LNIPILYNTFFIIQTVARVMEADDPALRAPLPAHDVIPDPNSFELRFFELQTRIRSAEFLLSTNREHIRAVFDECLALLDSAELVAFQLLFASWLLVQTDLEEVWQFCRDTQLLDPRATVLEPQLSEIVPRIRRIHGLIARLSIDLGRADLSSAPRKPAEVKEKWKMLDSNQALAQLSFDSPREFAPAVAPAPSPPEDFFSPPESFISAVCARMAESADESQSSEFRGHFGALVFRLRQSRTLRTEAAALKRRPVGPPLFWHRPSTARRSPRGHF